MEKLTLKTIAVPIIKAIDSFNFLLKSHHRRTAIIAYMIAKECHLDDSERLELIIAAAMHDIGALSIQERDSLVVADVEDPTPHCLMGYRMLRTFKPFERIARIIKHHHIHFDQWELVNQSDSVIETSMLLHLADRIDIQINPNQFILNQKREIINYIKDHSGSIFHPKFVEAFETASKADIFWIEINNLTMDQLFSRLQFTLDYQLSPENIIEFATTIAKIVDFRSHFTLTHSYTVAHLAEYFASVFELPSSIRKKLLVAGLLHDIGKIGIDPTYLEKPGKLTPDEFNHVKLHSYYTGQILDELSYSAWFHDIVLWARGHHERMDGSGYPYALTGDAIAFETKLLAFADVISALTEDRPYRDSLSIEEAFSIIEEKIAPQISMDIWHTIKQKGNSIGKIIAISKTLRKKEYQESIQHM